MPLRWRAAANHRTAVALPRAPKFGAGFKGDFAAGFRCLIPAAPAVPATAAKQQNDKYDDEKRGAIHIELLRQRPACFRTSRVCTATRTNPFDPYPFL